MRMSVKEEKNLLDHADGCVRGHAEGWHACVRTQMRVKEKKKKNLLTGASGGRGVRICCVRMCCVWMPMSAKKREEKKTYLEWGHADANALRADGVACGCQ